MNLKEIKEMIKLMNENSLSELEVEKEGMRIKLRKGGGAAEAPAVSYSPVVVEKEVAAQNGISLQEDKPRPAGKEIKAPMVGTFYRAPSPEAPPFVEIGQTIEIGQVVCIIEAMKLMNEIKSEVRGKVVDVLVDNADPVEFGQVMFVVEENK